MATLEVVTPLAPGTPDPQQKTWIRKTPDVVSGDACIRNTRITVWALVNWRRVGLPDDEILRGLPGLTQADLDAAWEYAARHPEEIEEAIRDNEGA